jgi:hypothetical protein
MAIKSTDNEVSLLADQVEAAITLGSSFRTQQEALLDHVEQRLAELRSDPGAERDAIAGLFGLRVQLRSALGLMLHAPSTKRMTRH